MKVLTVVGARPQFIKAAPVSKMLRVAGHTEVLVHTGQHYDKNMSAVFFTELAIAAPDYHLGIGSGSHAAQTGAMLASIEEVVLAQEPDWVLVYGDTNSTLAGALAAAKLHIPVAHIEAGLRSYNRIMPEEINRVLTDHVSHLLLCPSEVAVTNLAREGIFNGVQIVGDVMADALLDAADRAVGHSQILDTLGLEHKRYLLATVHRAENTDNLQRLRYIVDALERVNEPVVFPVHPRTQKCLQDTGLSNTLHRAGVHLIDPLGYLGMVRLMQSARMVLSDSGGVQKEAYWLGVPCVTLRDETEWVETVDAGWNILAGADTERIVQCVRSFVPPVQRPVLYGDGHAAGRCVGYMESFAVRP